MKIRRIDAFKKEHQIYARIQHTSKKKQTHFTFDNNSINDVTFSVSFDGLKWIFLGNLQIFEFLFYVCANMHLGSYFILFFLVRGIHNFCFGMCGSNFKCHR